jgi:hypothetical protein
MAVDRKKLVRETLETTGDYSGKTADFINALAEKIQAGVMPEQSEWEDLFTALEWLAEACSALAAEDSLSPASCADLKNFVTGLPSVLQDVSRALQKGDPVFLSDLLAYELAALTEVLHQSLLRAGLESEGQA